VRILSGDHAGTVAAVAGQVELPVDLARGGVTPEEKLAVIEQARREQPGRAVVMVGDGVNDAAALAAASVGVAVHGGAEASLTAADISVTRPGLSPVVDLLEGARRSMATIKLNLGVSLAYNAAAAAVCMTGVVTPLIAAILMPASSLTVLALAFRAWGRPRRSPSPAGASAAAAEPVADVSAVPATA
jgi:Cu2+-exporting ATPase